MKDFWLFLPIIRSKYIVGHIYINIVIPFCNNFLVEYVMFILLKPWFIAIFLFISCFIVVFAFFFILWVFISYWYNYWILHFLGIPIVTFLDTFTLTKLYLQLYYYNTLKMFVYPVWWLKVSRQFWKVRNIL